jgi:hypothetical protein
MLRKVKLSTYLSKLMKIEDLFAPELQSKFWEVFPRGLLSGVNKSHVVQF